MTAHRTWTEPTPLTLALALTFSLSLTPKRKSHA